MSEIKSVAILNPVVYGSTGKIAVGLFKYLQKAGFKALLCYGRGKRIKEDGYYKIDTTFEFKLHGFLSRFVGAQGAYSYFATRRLIAKLKNREVDTIFVVLMHGCYINEKLLFEYISNNNIRLIYLMADEYPYVGRCGFPGDCENYKTGCTKCPDKRNFPANYIINHSASIWKQKWREYRSAKRLAFVGPEYVIKRAKESPLMKGLNMIELDECVNLEKFHPRDTQDLRKKHGIPINKIIITCIAPYPDNRKGVQYFIEAAKKLEFDNRFVFLHVGFQGNKRNLPSNYIPISYVYDEDLLAEYLSVGDLFVFPSLADTMPNVCLIALGCGTPLLCFNISGMPYVGDETVMTLVTPRNADELVGVISSTAKKDESIINTCREYALKRYDAREYNKKLLNIAETI